MVGAPATKGRSSIARAASRCMNSSGDITKWVVPSRHGVLASAPPGPRRCTEPARWPAPSSDTNSPVDCLRLAKGRATGPARPARRAREGAAPLFQRFALVGPAAYRGVQAETLPVGPQVLQELCLPRHCALHPQHLLPGAWSKRDAASTGRSLQWPERAGVVRVGVVVGPIRLALLFGLRPCVRGARSRRLKAAPWRSCGCRSRPQRMQLMGQSCRLPQTLRAATRTPSRTVAGG